MDRSIAVYTLTLTRVSAVAAYWEPHPGMCLSTPLPLQHLEPDLSALVPASFASPSRRPSHPAQPQFSTSSGTALPGSGGRPEAMEVLVLYGYRAQKDDELNLAPGDVVRQVRRGPSRGWLRGELGGRCGLFPERLVQEIPENLRGAVEAPRPRCVRSRGHPAKSRGAQRWCKVNFNYSPEQADELQLQAGEMVEVLKEIEDGWWLGQKNGQLGAFPSNFVELLDSGPPSLDNPDVPSISSSPQRPPKLSSLTYDSPPEYLRTVSYPETYRVLFDYQPEAPDELELRRGDVVKVLRKTTADAGWWEGESQGRRGVFPDNFVLPPPPIKRLVPRKVVSRESVPVKEPKKMSKTVPPTVKKLVTVPTGPSKAKLSWTSSGENQKRPSRDSGSSGKVLGGAPGHPGRKRSKSQVPQQHPAPSQDDKQNSLAKAPSVNKTPTLDKNPKSEKVLHPDKAATPEKTRISDKVPSTETTPTLDKASTPEETLTPDKAPGPEKTPTLSKAPTPEKILTPDRAASPEKIPTLDEAPTPENILTLDEVPTSEKILTSDQVPSPERVFSMNEALGPDVPPEDEAPGLKMTPPGDEAPTLDTILVQEQVTCEEAPCTIHDSQSHRLSSEEALQKIKSLVSKETQSQEEVPAESQLQPNCPACNCSIMKPYSNKRDSSLLLPERVSKPTPDEVHSQTEATTLLQEVPLPAEDETTQKEEAPFKDEMHPQKEVTPKERGPSNLTPAPNKPYLTKPTPDPQDTPSPLQYRSECKDDREEDIVRLKVEVESLRRALELMGEQLERKLMDIREELQNEREQRQLLEVQMMQRTQESQSQDSIRSQTPARRYFYPPDDGGEGYFRRQLCAAVMAGRWGPGGVGLCPREREPGSRNPAVCQGEESAARKTFS
ncbi:PREDICTED: SH3 domain-containing protein 21 [Chrysochloris asiatica]|uniref:SH3 domain-containing protein 21 n=1 Tax=Chrysochloris asiatica TaxID=185453 RepID=A0A9B0WUQ1_CHRAS|nr:PREDICTED: SH3 domain-containing protein 21 [Chrysochloris asiatica]